MDEGTGLLELYQRSGDPNAALPSGTPFLHQAIIDNQPQLVAELVQRHADLQLRDSLGFTPLQLAQALGRHSCLQFLRQHSERRIKVGQLNSPTVDLLTVKEFEQWTGVRYTPFLEVPDLKTLRFACRCCWRGIRKKHFDTERRWLARWHGEEMATAQVNAGVVKWIEEPLGYGLFAEHDMSAFTFVGAYTGCLTRRDFFRLRSNDYCFRYPTGVVTMRPLIIDAEAMGNELRYANHSDKPNMDGIGVLHGPMVQVIFRTNRVVRQGEQLTYDYGVDYWKHRDIPKQLL
jgi:hypothetical protein